ncbi:hypothetical protein EJ04DRAFT_97384 [Polyplosphaeria fusca]|uniref:F-box domain-containing protein n=1 Tax=Polyplosphaeria fusca TaxID=682080 RepID=A0A9P4UXT0_9PLEO|nr:hypothetical protein EJ04DRAFT_97384 [Polyplosphaeria fusca]
MPSFSHLPAELRLCIAEVSSPRDCFNFALVNRATWELIKPIIKRHKTLAEKYSWLQTESSEHLVWTLLNDVLENPDVASYVRSIELNGSREVWHDPQVYYHTVLDQESLRPPPRDVERYVLAANRSPFLRTPLEPTMQSERMHNSEPMDLDQIIADGADGPIVALLLPMLENLQTLCYTMAGDCHWLLHILRQVVLAAHDQSRLSLPLPLPFQKLTRVSIACWSEDGGGDRWLHCILSLPALESFSANSLRGIDFSLTADDELRSMAPTSYNVSRLEFTHSDLDSSFLEWVIGRCKALKVFRYQNGAMHESFARYDPRALIAALISNCSQTLEELVLVDLEGSNRVSLSLRTRPTDN